jgi:pyrophosphatase PpaX
MKKLDTIIFDLDGTLIDTNDIIIRSFRSTFDRHFPEVEVTNYQIHSFIGPTLEQTFSDYTNDPFEIQDMIDSYREFYVKYEVGNFQIYPDVIEVVKDLKEKDYNLAILTSKFKVAAWPSFTHYNLDQIFDVFVSLDDVEFPKPHKNAVETVLSHFPESKTAIMIGDNQGDILAGKNAGIYSAGVAWSLKGKEHLMEVQPDFMLESMNDIYRVISIIEEEE